jgi:hypothetical protein
MMKQPLSIAIISTILLLSTISPLFAQTDTPLVGKAVDAAAIRPAPKGSSYTNPQPGPVQECAGINRQFYLMNPTVVEGEPVLFRLVLQAIDPKTKPEFQGRMILGTDTQVHVFPPPESGIVPYSFLGLNLGSVLPNSVLKFDGFTKYRHDFYLSVDKETISGAAFEFPGTYHLKVLMNCYYQGAPMGQLAMGTFVLEVKEAKDDDLMANEILSDDYTLFEYVQLRGASYPNLRDPMTEDQTKLLLQLIEKCPKAAIRPHAMILMASYYLHQKQPDKALELDKQIQSEYQDIPIYDEARFDEMAVHLTYRDDDKAFDIFNKIWADPYSTQIAYPGSSHYNKWIVPRLPKGDYTQWMITDADSPDPEMTKEQAPGQMLNLSPEIQAQLGLSGTVTLEDFNEALNKSIITNPGASTLEFGE